MRFLRDVSFGALIFLLTNTTAFAQATAQLGGRVTDESGGVLPGVTVTVTQTDTGLMRTSVTDESGAYVIPNLPTGPYRLEASLQGFRTYAQTGIVLQVGATPTINVVLAVGNLAETVSVEGAAPLVDVKSAGISDVVENERILELPLQARQVTDLIVLAGAAVQTATADSRSMQGGVSIAVAGGLSFGVAYLLDGAMHNNPQNNANLPLPFPDALQEFSVATSGLSAQNGMHSAASVNAVTKSGTNNYHGNAFEFLRDHRFNAINPFSAIGPDGKRLDDGLKRNQFGGTLGGPIVRDKLFFFGGYQGTSTTQRPAANKAFVPTAAMMAGDFAAFAAPACNAGRPVALRAPFVNNTINPALFSPAAVNLAKRLPTTTDPCGEVTYVTTNDSTEGQSVARIDYQMTPNHTLFGRYMATYHNEPAPYSRSKNVLTTGTPGLDNLAQSLALGDTTIYGHNMVNAIRFAFNRTAVHRGTPPFFDGSDLGSKVISYKPGEMVLTVTGGFNISAATATTGIFITNASQLGDDLTLVRGNHQLGIGGSLAYWKMDFLTHARSGGNWIISGQSTGLGLADFLTGRIASLEQGGPAALPMDMWYLGLYAQDTWRVTSRTTINWGLRWEPYFGQNVLNNAIYNFNMDDYRKNVKSQVFVNAPAGLLYPGDAGFPGGQTGLHKQWLNFSPRVGWAWDIAGNGRTALRSSYGISYDFPTAERHNINASAPPFGNRSLITDPPGGFDDPYGAVGGNPHPIVTNRDTRYIPFGAFGATDPDINSPRIQSWNVTVEREVGKVWSVAASYLGSHSDRLWNQLQVNPAVFLGTGPCILGGVSYPVCSTTANTDARRMLTITGENPAAAALIGNLDLHVSIGKQDYKGLKLSFRRRSANGVTLNGNYTVSRCYGDTTNGGFPQLAQGFQDPANPARDRGRCDQDRTHLASFTVGYRTPDFTNRGVRIVASGWRVSGVVNARSGSWLTVTTGRDLLLNGQRFQEQRVTVVNENPYGDKSLNNYLSPAAFAQPAPGTFGNEERNSIMGPNFWSSDMAVSRLVTFGKQNVELRLEAFNLTNHINWANPNTTLTAGTFGQIRAMAGEPRVLQFGMKYGF
jgi:Carboxypeptidase regulatory-like domain